MSSKTNTIFIDLDGTLVDSKNHTISPMNKNAIENAMKKNMNIIPSTGRLVDSAFRVLKHLKCEYVICGNGSVILKNWKIIVEHTISTKLQEAIFGFAEKHKLSVRTNDEKILFYSGKNPVRKFVNSMAGYKQTTNAIIVDKKVFKFVMFGYLPSKNRRLAKKLVELGGGKIFAVTSFNGWIIEVTDIEATKGKAAKYLLETKLKNIGKTIHIGDSMNDSTTLGVVDNLIALKSGSKKLMSIANTKGPNYKNGGVAKLLNAL